MKNLEDKIIEIYTKAIELAREKNQTIGEKNDYYITLEQLEKIVKGRI